MIYVKINFEDEKATSVFWSRLNGLGHPTVSSLMSVKYDVSDAGLSHETIFAHLHATSQKFVIAESEDLDLYTKQFVANGLPAPNIDHFLNVYGLHCYDQIIATEKDFNYSL